MTEKNEPGVYFNKLNKEEKKSKLLQLLSMAKAEVTVWEKGSSDKLSLELSAPLISDTDSLVLSKNVSNLVSKTLLVNFTLSGLNFFSQVKIYQKEEKFYLSFYTDLFKSERRANFRLLTDPHHEVYLYIEMEPSEDEDSNVVSLKTRTSETGLFKNFLKLVDNDQEEGKFDQHLKIKVLDISVSGAALIVGEYEKANFEGQNIEFSNIHLDFNGTFFTIPGLKVHYLASLKSKSTAAKLYKAGVEFLGIDTNLDEQLSSLINATLRGADKEFEDFLK